MSSETLVGLKKAILEYEAEQASHWAKQAVQEKINPLEALEAITETIREIGDRFGTGELFLPDLVGASDAMQAALPPLEEELKKLGTARKVLGTVVIGTVAGDIHNIGKDMVSTLLTAAGFHVRDLGVDVKAERFLEAVRADKPDILAMSALLTVTALEQRKIIHALKEEELRNSVKIMVGGGAITQEFADEIGADGYDPTAPGAVKLAKQLLGAGE